MLSAKDSVFSQARTAIQANWHLMLLYNSRILIRQERYQYKVRSFILLTVLGVFLLLALIFYLNARQKQKSKIKIENAYKGTEETTIPAYPIRKMASLGELTVG
jgi:multisubunit Na+/H+ antiporter MnhB subunit